MGDYNIFDSHAHYNDSKFSNDRDKTIQEVHEKGVCGIIECATTLEDSIQCINLANKYNYVYSAVGVHPESITDLDDNWTCTLEKLTKNTKVVAIGEIGLDYHWDTNPCKSIQLSVFEKQLILANKLSLPVIIHDRDAHEDTYNLLRKYKPMGVIHCFSGSLELAKVAINLGMYIGLGGVVTFKNAKHSIDVAKYVPDDRLLLETDAPYMAPVPFRGKRNDSSLIPYSAEIISKLKGIPKQKLLNTTYANAKRLFSIE